MSLTHAAVRLHLGHWLLPAIAHRAAANTCVAVCVWRPIFILLRLHPPRSGVAGSYSNAVFNLKGRTENTKGMSGSRGVGFCALDHPLVTPTWGHSAATFPVVPVNPR